MEKNIISMTKILKEETSLFEKMCALEKSKTEAIVEHNAQLIESISLEQEELLGKISTMEHERAKQMEDYRKHRHINNISFTLRDMAEVLGGATATSVLTIGRNLKDVMLRLGRMQDTNRVLINDNMEYYNILLTGLRRDRSMETGYGRDGREDEKLKNSILFNQTA
jgi:hypothetical protein